VIAGHQFVLGFRQVKRNAARLGKTRDDEYDKAEELRYDEPDIPLGLDDRTQAERPRSITTPSSESP
jgi:hypothetical protein